MQQRNLWREELHQEVIFIIPFLVSVYTVSWFLFLWWAKKNNPGSQRECFINASALISRVSNAMGKQIKIWSLLGYAITAVDEKGKMWFFWKPKVLHNNQVEIKDKSAHTRKKATFLLATGKVSDLFSDFFFSHKRWKGERQEPFYPTESVQEDIP